MSAVAAARNAGDLVVVKLIIEGREVLAHGQILRVPRSVAESYLIAVPPTVDLRADVSQRLMAADREFLTMNVRGDSVWDNIAPAVAVTQLEPPVVAPGPVLDVPLALSAFQSALDAGFLSASGSDADAVLPQAAQPGLALGEGGIPPGSGATASSFEMLQPSSSA